MPQVEYPIEVDITQGRWRITASYAPESNVDVYLDGEHWRTFTVPGVRIWNIPAHLDEYVAILDGKLAVEAAEEGMTVEEARRVWDGQHADDADPIKVKAAERILTGNGWDW